MAPGPLMAHQPSPQFLKNHPTATTVFSSHHHSTTSSSSSLAAVSLPQQSFPPPSSVAFISDSDVAAARHLLHLSSDADADADDASVNFGSHHAKTTPTTTCQISRGGDDSNAAAPAHTCRKRRFASISVIYSRTKPLKAWKVGF